MLSVLSTLSVNSAHFWPSQFQKHSYSAVSHGLIQGSGYTRLLSDIASYYRKETYHIQNIILLLVRCAAIMLFELRNPQARLQSVLGTSVIW